MAIEFRFHTEQEVGLAWLREHGMSVECGGQGFRNVTAGTVGSLADEAAGGTRQPRQLQRQGMQLRRLRMLLGCVAEEYRAPFAIEQASRDRLAGRARFDGGEFSGNGLALQLGRGLDHSRQSERQAGGRHAHPGVQVDQWIVGTKCQQAHLAPFLGELAQALRKQGVVLAQEAAHHQRRIKVLDFRQLEAKPRNAVKSAVSREVASPRAKIDVTGTE